MPKRRCFFRGSSAANLGYVWTIIAQREERLRLFLSECGRRARVLRDGLLRQPDRIDPSSRFVPGFRYGYGEREARGLKLLREWLSPEQFAQYDAKSYFEVTGCHSGKRYRISHGTSMNVHEIDGAGCPHVGWCFAPEAYLVACDVMLAQKIALETDERGALAVAKQFFVSQQADEICFSITELWRNPKPMRFLCGARR